MTLIHQTHVPNFKQIEAYVSAPYIGKKLGLEVNPERLTTNELLKVEVSHLISISQTAESLSGRDVKKIRVFDGTAHACVVDKATGKESYIPLKSTHKEFNSTCFRIMDIVRYAFMPQPAPLYPFYPPLPSLLNVGQPLYGVNGLPMGYNSPQGVVPNLEEMGSPQPFSTLSMPSAQAPQHLAQVHTLPQSSMSENRPRFQGFGHKKDAALSEGTNAHSLFEEDIPSASARRTGAAMTPSEESFNKNGIHSGLVNLKTKELEELSDSVAKAQKATEQLQSLMQENSVLKIEADIAKKKIEDLSGKKAKLSGKLEVTQAEIEACKKSLATLHKKGEESEQLLLEKQKELEALENRHTALEAKLNKTTDELGTLQQKLDKLTKTNHNLDEKSDQLSRSNEDLKKALAGSKEETRLLDGKLADLTNERDALIANLKKEREALAACTQEFEQLKHEADNLKKAAGSSEKNLNKLSSEKENLEAQLAQTRDALKAAQEQLVDAQEKIAKSDEIKAANAQLKEELDRAEKNRQATEAALRRAAEDKLALETELETAKGMLLAKEAENRRLDEHLKDLESEIFVAEDNFNLEEELGLASEVSPQEIAIDQLQQELEIAHAKESDLERQLNHYKAAIAQLMKERETLVEPAQKAATVAVPPSLSHNKKLELELQDALKLIGQLQATVSHDYDREEEMREASRRLKEQLDQRENALKEIMAAKQEIEDHLTSATKRLDESEKRIKQYKGQNERHAKEIEQLQEEQLQWAEMEESFAKKEQTLHAELERLRDINEQLKTVDKSETVIKFGEFEVEDEEF